MCMYRYMPLHCKCKCMCLRLRLYQYIFTSDQMCIGIGCKKTKHCVLSFSHDIYMGWDMVTFMLFIVHVTFTCRHIILKPKPVHFHALLPGPPSGPNNFSFSGKSRRRCLANTWEGSDHLPEVVRKGQTTWNTSRVRPPESANSGGLTPDVLHQGVRPRELAPSYHTWCCEGRTCHPRPAQHHQAMRKACARGNLPMGASVNWRQIRGKTGKQIPLLTRRWGRAANCRQNRYRYWPRNKLEAKKNILTLCRRQERREVLAVPFQCHYHCQQNIQAPHIASRDAIIDHSLKCQIKKTQDPNVTN